MTQLNSDADTFHENRTAAEMPAAIIYTHSMIEGSMTFIKSQAEALERYCPIYCGAHRIKGIPLPDDRTYILNEGTLLGTLYEAIFRQWGLAPLLVKKLKAHNPQVVHAHFGTCGPAGLSLARSLQVPLVVTFHGHDATMHTKEARRTIRGRELLRKKGTLIEEAGAFIAVSEYIRTRLIEQGYPPSKVLLHRNGIDLDFFRPEGPIEKKPIIVCVGRFVEKKGMKYLIEAARTLREQTVAFDLVIIGNGPLEDELKALAKKARVPCRFVGFLPIDEVRDWLGKASVVAIPSVTAENGDSEGLPTILLEAQAMETPVVATRHSGIPEGMLDGVTGELVDEHDTSALAEKLRSFLDSPTKVSSFGRAGRRFVTEHFDMRSQVRGLEEIYKDLSEVYLTHSKS